MSAETKQAAEVEKGAHGDDAAGAWSARRDELARVYGEHQITWTEHPYVVRVEGYRGREPIVLGTNVPVRSIVGYCFKLGMTVEQVVDELVLTHAQVYDALSYYYDHKDGIDEDIARNDDVEYWMKQAPPGQYEICRSS